MIYIDFSLYFEFQTIMYLGTLIGLLREIGRGIDRVSVSARESEGESES